MKRRRGVSALLSSRCRETAALGRSARGTRALQFPEDHTARDEITVLPAITRLGRLTPVCLFSKRLVGNLDFESGAA
jgi:hypothetical protein